MIPQLSPSPDLARDAARPHIAEVLDGLPTTLAGAPAFDPEFRTAERIDLDEHSWIDVVPGWLERDETPRNAQDHPWRERLRVAPREPIVELTVPYTVPDVARFVLDVQTR